MRSAIQIQANAPETPIVKKILELIERQVRRRSGEASDCRGDAGAEVELETRQSIGAEGYEIADGPEGGVRVLGNDGPGLLYGVGKLLRASRYDEGQFTPSPWRGTSVPERDLRGIYFATHFHNYYHEAPVEEVTRYIEDLALWGTNCLVVWFDMHHFNGFDDPAAQDMLDRLRAYLAAAKGVGMKAGLTLLANECYADSPEELRIPKTPGAYGVELCPSKPGAEEVVLRGFEELFSACSDIGIDLFNIWPYDQGGCACAECWPWGANGFLKIAQPVAELGKRLYPNAKVVLSAWYLDHYILNSQEMAGPYTKGDEWDGLVAALADKPDWLDYILLDEEGARSWPARLDKDGVSPGGSPLVTFPEISMRGMKPWGGFGANPQPGHLPVRRNSKNAPLAGGFPYSEGMYEDINKAIMAQFYWSDAQDSLDTVREYVSFEYSPDLVDEITRAIQLQEQTMMRKGEIFTDPVRFVLEETEGVREAYEMLAGVESQLPRWARDSWRWKVLFLRSVIDRELVEHDFTPSERCEEAFHELTALYHSHRGIYSVTPPTRAAIDNVRDYERKKRW